MSHPSFVVSAELARAAWSICSHRASAARSARMLPCGLGPPRSHAAKAATIASAGSGCPIVQRVGAVEHLRHPLGRLSAYIAHDAHADQ